MKPLRVGVLGGGPAGLYTAILLKRINPAHEVTLLERNPAGATFGFGVVLSDRTLTSFREADPKTFDEITAHQVMWDALDVHHRGEVVRCGGHFYLGIARKRLLDILQRRAEELGVNMQFEVDVTDLAPFADCDLIVAADGRNSLVRRLYGDVFQPHSEPGEHKYIWLATDWVPSAFTFIFIETEFGLFQAHMYPYEGQRSTCIVMCRPETWQRAGLDKLGEAESVRFCQELLTPYIGKRNFFTNRSIWYDWETLTNKNWSHGNIVLLGDAVHTAHWSIGSGTKLAMEDAIALVGALERHDGEITTALSAYQTERKPVVERLQDASRISLRHCENAERYMHLAPRQFAFQLMVRSKRLDYDNLRLRDAQFVDAVDRWFAHAAAAGGTDSQPALVAPPPLLTPFKLRELTLANRIVCAQTPTDPSTDGLPGPAACSELNQLAKTGAGLVQTEIVAVAAAGRITPDCPGMYHPEHLRFWQETVARIHGETGARIALQLGHAGRRGATRPRRRGLDRPLDQGGWPLLSASAMPYTPAGPVPKEMDELDLAAVRDQFVQAAEMAAAAGCDLLQLHMAHGYLLAGFLSPLSNRRRDAYGGSLENRLRYPLEVLTAVRAVWPADRPLAVALSASDWARGGLTADDAAVIARTLAEHGCDLVQVLAGYTTADSKPEYGAGFLTPLSEHIRNAARVPTLVGGYLTTTGQVNTIIAGARADLCILETL